MQRLTRHKDDESQARGSLGSTGSSQCNKTFWVSFWKCLQWRPSCQWWCEVDCSRCVEHCRWSCVERNRFSSAEFQSRLRLADLSCRDEQSDATMLIALIVHVHRVSKQALLPQRDRATRYISRNPSPLLHSLRNTLYNVSTINLSNRVKQSQLTDV